MHFGQTGIDFETIRAEISEKWEPTDAPIYIVHNFTDVRMELNVTLNGK
jgi:hypothetical protein